MKRSLSLKRERLTELAADTLTSVAGGQNVKTLPVPDCLFATSPGATCACCTPSGSC